MLPRFAQLPASIRDLARTVRIAGDGEPASGIPALLIHPDWATPAPTVLWLHGRTANKELDPGRYARWVKGGGGGQSSGGLAAVAIDLPGHGERAARDGDLSLLPAHEMIPRALPEIDRVLDALAAPEWNGVFDLDRTAIGGMSLGGMIAMRRLCEPHTFTCAAVEGTTGDLAALYEHAHGPGSAVAAGVRGAISAASPQEHLAGFRPIPLLSLHSEADRIVPWPTQRGFLDRLRDRYREAGVDPALIESRTWPTTGAPQEHIGFGRLSNDAKNLQTEFLTRWLRPGLRDGR